nr:coat protein [Carrot cryptic virus 3]
MARNVTTDPKEELIADGRVYNRPAQPLGLPVILNFDLEFSVDQIITKLAVMYGDHYEVRARFGGYNNNANARVTACIHSLGDYIGGQIYNRLRANLDWCASNVRTARMNTRCPVSGALELPTWIASTISSLGPVRFQDGPVDRLAAYATPTATMNHYGRAGPTVFNFGDFTEITNVLREIGVTFAPVDHRPGYGSFYPTIAIQPGDNNYTFYATCHASHYENEDFIRLSLFTNQLGVTPFENIGITVGYVDDEATTAALAAVAAPPDIPAGQTAASAGRLTGGLWNVNYYGLQLAVLAQGETPARPRGFYVIGRGMERRFQTILARDITITELHQALMFRLYKKN